MNYFERCMKRIENCKDIRFDMFMHFYTNDTNCGLKLKIYHDDTKVEVFYKGVKVPVTSDEANLLKETMELRSSIIIAEKENSILEEL